ncbi:sensor histidine kinase [Coralloluteibacterium stylophorae]|uniref:histidine kinase n=1 Tax=Coralloluteibacterium stylophorae TaxID=1776034 RepID=A0A8J8AXC3_9GAMM|nr:HAMP domain-containing sensor histidine kinase [Coralloluteibacterium stylophorae]MBS7455776.1 HAMP domain-containing histidine kinase [Coralloluteibacterium stylophorae]
MNAATSAARLRILPRTLAVRLGLILLAGLLLAQALSVALLFHERRVTTSAMMLTNLEEDAAVSVALLERLSPSERAQWLPRLQRRTYRYLLRSAQPGRPLDNERARRVTALIGDALGRRYALRPRAVSASPERYEVELTLADGQPLTMEVTPAPLPLAQWLPWMLLAQATLLLGCAWLAVRLATRPLARLADAAERLDLGGTRSVPVPHAPREVAAAARALNALQARIAAHVAERTRILAAISHDLQTPITRMRLRLEALDASDAQARLLEDVTRLGQLVKEGVDYARSGSATNSPMLRVDLQAFLASVAGDYQDGGRAVHTGERLDARVRTRPQVLRRIVQNLVDNALLYGGGSASLHLRQARDGAIRIDVEDRGPGIPEDALEDVLQPFHRLETSRGRTTGGTGLGLAIAQQLAGTLGATLALTNRSGGGLRATLILLPRDDSEV